MDPTLLGILASSAVTAFGAWLLHKRERIKDNRAGEVATTAMHKELDVRMQSHVQFVEARMQGEREYYERKLNQERQECDDRITNLAGRLGIAEGELRKLRGAQGDSKEG